MKLIARPGAYHGGTLLTTSMTGLPAFWKYFGPLIPEVVHTAAPEEPCDCVPNTDGECACWLEAAIEREGLGDRRRLHRRAREGRRRRLDTR